MKNTHIILLRQYNITNCIRFKLINEVTYVQRAMSKLSNVVFKSPRDTYEFANEAFTQWARTLAE